MKSENKYIGDDKFKKFLEHYHCPVPFEVVKFRFIGALCSPNIQLRPTDIISSLWNNQTPRLITKNEAELFFKFFMGFWDEVLQMVATNDIKFSYVDKNADLMQICQNRYDELEQGFIEGFFGGKENIKVPAYIAEISDSISNLALVYKKLMPKIKPQSDNTEIFKAIIECDKAASKSIAFIVENYVLPRMEKAKQTIN